MKLILIQKKYIIILLTSVFLISCVAQKNNQYLTENSNIQVIEESEILQIQLEGEVSKRRSEISGLCWYGDKLILLPQYPNDFGNGKIFYIQKKRLQKFISGKDKTPITPKYFSIDLTDFEDFFSPGSGFESITINKNKAFFTIESIKKGETKTFLVFGFIDSTKQTVKLEKKSLTKVESKLSINNISDESILFFNNTVIPIYESYGKNINKNPKVSIYNQNLIFKKKIEFPNVEYRLTDVTSVDSENKFWAINFLYPGDIKKLQISKDDIILEYGLGKSHFNSKAIERLLEFQIKNDKIELVKRSPIYLKLMPNDSRNWEGIVRFGEKEFIIITDTFPKTILAYVNVKK